MYKVQKPNLTFAAIDSAMTLPLCPGNNSPYNIQPYNVTSGIDLL